NAFADDENRLFGLALSQQRLFAIELMTPQSLTLSRLLVILPIMKGNVGNASYSLSFDSYSSQLHSGLLY
ncbi:MAG: hypothetical protein AAGL18_12520, partial [Pseudomonadota bacterium]